MIDLRSDTVTRPTEGMRRAMYAAEVGDDVLGDDPTVRRLEERVADLLGKEAALFVPSGTMGNQLAIKSQTEPGDEVLLDRTAHIFNYESAAAGLISGVQLNPLEGEDGILRAGTVRAAIRGADYWLPRTRLCCLENTLNRAGGALYPLDEMQAVAAVCRAHGLSVHLDGARLWHAAVATGVPEKDFAAPVDTVNVCLSKGLGAPVGSVLAGSRAVIERAHRFRKLLGGGMRQVGILAAAGLYALDHHRDRLHADHRNARRLAEAFADLPLFRLDPFRVETNIVMMDVAPGHADAVLERLTGAGILLSRFGPDTLRASTHLDVSERDVERVRQILPTLFDGITP